MKCSNCNADIRDDAIYCPHCGSKVGESGSTASLNIETVPTEKYINLGSFDISKIMKLIKNPYESLFLDGEKDLNYGILGFISSIIGLYLWFLGIIHIITADVNTGTFHLVSININYFQVLIASILIVLFISLSPYVISLWLGTIKISFRRAFLLNGSVQYIPAILFILCAVLAFIDIYVSFAFFLITFITYMIFIIMFNCELFKIKDSKKIFVIFASVTIYLVLFKLALNQILTYIMLNISNFF
ncbi:zinc ribbon domain-containing protein [Thermoanaerobacterium thermosaccharolyticum]|uniref:zinc ribbon domain-containing protein n=1 Tax=Thermoanaerobacterium thermosaccharolyticum TaxID=1517 RepID=UPI00178307A2|nr:zinc ribbon domain-containing protein [Thermoanaerobacterium thermosaccharolyticum]MBE0069896.1 zinc ribbon domain-containing protein [Thermoanaerobacterium thermosaccharolyticum]MBE0228024.1 zinc ribbon domain-containing protein [Thermoanaerobacterium thermosaccharolyticum]